MPSNPIERAWHEGWVDNDAMRTYDNSTAKLAAAAFDELVDAARRLLNRPGEAKYIEEVRARSGLRAALTYFEEKPNG